ncbi:MAG: fibrobacter succinogenes major paralogous domain-containing protein [Ignavibacteria bacterium]|nr:fibrobacter succinogenes major paralogous domain-containing protein [Ignavibacteria bacterium]
MTTYPPWGSLTTPAYCWYDNVSANKNTYGALYNWLAVKTGKLAPEGWHVATSAEWKTLITYFGDKLKESSTSYWNTPNSGGNNESGFTALPGGYIDNNGIFKSLGFYGLWWTSTVYQNGWIYGYHMHYLGSIVYEDWFNSTWGLSVRCVKDN